MVIIASYESSQNCAGVATCLRYLHSVMNMSFCQPQASAQGLLMINIQVQRPGLLWIWLQFQKYSPSINLSLLFRRRRLKKRWESWQLLWRWPPWMWRCWSESKLCGWRRDN